MSGAVERIQVLDAIEKDIITCLQSAGLTHSVFKQLVELMLQS